MSLAWRTGRGVQLDSTHHFLMTASYFEILLGNAADSTWTWTSFTTLRLGSQAPVSSPSSLVRGSSRRKKRRVPSVASKDVHPKEGFGFRRGDIYIRRGDSTVRIQTQAELEDVLERLRGCGVVLQMQFLLVVEPLDLGAAAY